VYHRAREIDVRDTMRPAGPVVGRGTELPIDGTVNPAKVAQNAEWAAKSAMFATRDGLLLNELHRRFRELFAAPLSLPELAAIGADGRRGALDVEIVWNEAAKDALRKRLGAWTDDGLTHYDSQARRLYHCISDEAVRAQDEVPAAGGWLQKRSDQTLLAAGTQQLLDQYREASDTRPSSAAWFGEGFPKFLGAIEADAASIETLVSAKWRHERVLLLAVTTGRASRTSWEAWSLAELLVARSADDATGSGQRLTPGDSRASSMFRSRAWAFCHFLWNYDGGKHRAALIAYVGDVLRGTASADRFATSMGAGDGDWSTVEREFEWYWSKLLNRKVEKSKVTGEWSKPSTDAPTGAVEDDTEFCEVWAEKRRSRAK
jgi:hypothetical protein